MRKVLIALLSILVLGVPGVHAQNTTQADQIMACQQKVEQLTEQLRPLQTKLSSLRAERKGISASGGEVARFKLSNLDQDISQTTKQLDGVNGQINTEKKRCDDLAHKPAPAPAPSPAPRTRPSR